MESNPIPPKIKAFIATKNICKPKKEQQLTTVQAMNGLFLNVPAKALPKPTCFSSASGVMS